MILTLNIDALGRLSTEEMIAAIRDFDLSIRHRKQAHHTRRAGGPWSRVEFALDLRRARRVWVHYSNAVRKAARQERLAA